MSNVNIFTTFLTNTVSFLSPYILPLMPNCISCVTNRSLTATQHTGIITHLPTTKLDLYFILKFSAIFILLNTNTDVLNRLLLACHCRLGLINNTIIVLFKLFVLNIFHINLFFHSVHFDLSIPNKHPLKTCLLKLTFTFN